MKLIDKDALLAIMKEKVESLLENNQRLYDEYGNYFYKNIDNDYRFYHKIDDFEWDEDKLSLSDIVGYIFPIDTQEVKEVDNWHLQSKEDIYDAVKDWGSYSFVCIMKDGTVQRFVGCLGENCEGHINVHIDGLNEDYDNVDDIVYWIEIPAKAQKGI